MQKEQKEQEKNVGSSEDISKEGKAFISEYMALTSDGLLMKEGHITVRMFSVTAGATVVAFVFSELPDSFVVGFPAAISTYKGTGADGIIARMVAPVSMVRLYKSNVSMSAMPPPRFLLAYLLSCKSQLKVMPGFFNEDRKSQVEALISILKKSEGLNEIKTEHADDSKLRSIDPFKPGSPKVTTPKTGNSHSFDSFESDFLAPKVKPKTYRH